MRGGVLGFSGCATAADPFRAGWHLALVLVALEGGGAGVAEGEVAEAVACCVSVPAAGPGAYGTGAWFAGWQGGEAAGAV
jgi:hypothetical protein